jgi:hypothetical protein
VPGDRAAEADRLSPMRHETLGGRPRAVAARHFRGATPNRCGIRCGNCPRSNQSSPNISGIG